MDDCGGDPHSKTPCWQSVENPVTVFHVETLANIDPELYQACLRVLERRYCSKPQAAEVCEIKGQGLPERWWQHLHDSVN